MPAVSVAAGSAGGPGGGGAKGTKGKKAGGGRGQKGKGGKNKKKKECKKKVSSNQKQKLREATPSKKITNKLNKKTPRKCPTCGQASPPGFKAGTGRIYDKLSGDHIVPFDTIIKKKNFACLSEKNQKKVLNNEKNFAAICPPCNTSRGTKKWNEWNGNPHNGLTSAGKKFIKETGAKVPSLSKNLGAQISRL